LLFFDFYGNQHPISDLFLHNEAFFSALALNS